MAFPMQLPLSLHIYLHGALTHQNRRNSRRSITGRVPEASRPNHCRFARHGGLEAGAVGSLCHRRRLRNPPLCGFRTAANSKGALQSSKDAWRRKSRLGEVGSGCRWRFFGEVYKLSFHFFFNFGILGVFSCIFGVNLMSI